MQMSTLGWMDWGVFEALWVHLWEQGLPWSGTARPVCEQAGSLRAPTCLLPAPGHSDTSLLQDLISSLWCHSTEQTQG